MKTYCLLAVLFLESWMASAQLSGSYTINAGAPTAGNNFHSFTDCAGQLAALGISGNVTVTVVPASGPYNEQVTFHTIPGAGPAAVVTLEGSGETITAVTTTTDRHVVRLEDVQYVVINHLRVAWNPSSTGGFYGIHLYHSCRNITISNCAVSLGNTTSTLYGAYVASGSTTSILDSGDFQNITLIGDTASGGGYGASFFGKPSLLATGIVISNCVFYDAHSNGVYLRETDGADIRNNFFDKRTSVATSANFIQVAQQLNRNTLIHGNYITVSQVNNSGGTLRGIYLFNGTGHRVYNNVITDVRLVSGNFTGIEVRTGGTAPELSFNTISLDNGAGTTGDLFGIKEELSNTNAVLRNNLVSISQPTTGTKAGLILGAIATVTTAFNSNYNDIYVPGGNAAMKSSTTPVMYATLGDWQGASGQDANSVSLNPQFVSAAVPQPANGALDNLGVPLAGITTDFTGAVRSTPPDIGAYEFTGVTGISALPAAGAACYPNPFMEYLQVRSADTRAAVFLLYDGAGRLRMKRQITGAAKVETGELACGMYWYEIRSRSGVTGRGLVVKE
jgi:hypothetical protein